MDESNVSFCSKIASTYQKKKKGEEKGKFQIFGEF